LVVAVVFVCFAVGAVVIVVGVALIICFVVRHKSVYDEYIHVTLYLHITGRFTYASAQSVSL